MATPPTPAVRSGARFTGILTGCAVGCFGLLVMLVIGVVLVINWASRAEPLPSAEALLDPGVRGYVEVAGNPDDGGALRFVEAISADGSGDERMLARALPIRLSAVMTGTAQSPRYYAVLSVSRYANLLRLLTLPLRLSGGEADGVKHHRDTAIFRDARKSGAVAMLGGSLIIASHESAARVAIDRLLDADGGKASDELLALLPAASDFAVRGALVNRDGELLKLLIQLGWPGAELLRGSEVAGGGADALPEAPPPVVPESGPETSPPATPEAAPVPPAVEPQLAAANASLSQARGVAVRFKLGSPDPGSVEGVVELVYDDDASSHLESMRALGVPVERYLHEHGISSVASMHADGTRLRITVRLDDVAPALSGRSIRIGPIEVK